MLPAQARHSDAGRKAGPESALGEAPLFSGVDNGDLDKSWWVIGMDQPGFIRSGLPLSPLKGS